MKLVLLAPFLCAVSAKIYFQEQFDDSYSDRWTVSTEWKKAAEMGAFEHTAGTVYADANDKGIKTSQDARFYAISAPLTEAFDNKGKDLVLQYTVRHDQDVDCGGAYIKLLPKVDAKSFGGPSEYSVMFGPDFCGHTKRTHVIFNYNGDNLLTKDEPRAETDKKSHLYTLIVKPDNTYEVLIDNESAKSGSLFEHWDFLEPKEIKDPSKSKPSDWVDEKKIPDPEDTKPEGYDNIPETIPDPEAEQPEDWDVEEDGDWEAPQIPNPEYKGPFVQKQIDNPAYKGEWVHPMVANPAYKEDDTVYNRCNPCTAIGFELWQVKAGTLFDDIIVTDSVEEAKKFAADTFAVKSKAEQAMQKKLDEEAAAKAAEESKKKEAEEEDWEEEEEEEEGKEEAAKKPDL
jgi:calreticulin